MPYIVTTSEAVWYMDRNGTLATARTVRHANWSPTLDEAQVLQSQVSNFTQADVQILEVVPLGNDTPGEYYVATKSGLVSNAQGSVLDYMLTHEYFLDYANKYASFAEALTAGDAHTNRKRRGDTWFAILRSVSV